MNPALAVKRRFLLMAGCYVALWLGAWYSAQLLESWGSVSLWYLPAGLRFSALLLLGWPGLLLEIGTILTFVLLQFGTSDTPWPGLLTKDMLWRLFDLFAFVIAYAAVVFPLRWRLGGQLDLTRPQHSGLFLGAALAASVLGAVAGTFHRIGSNIISAAPWTEVLGTWFIGDFIGIVTLAPWLLVCIWPRLNHYLRHGRWTRSHPSTAAANAMNRRSDQQTTLVSALALLPVFVIPISLQMNQHFGLIALLLLLPLAAVALRHRLRGAVLAVMLLDGGLTLIIALSNQREMAAQYQLVMIAIALVGLWLGGVAESHHRVMQRQQDFARVSNDLLWETDSRGRLLNISGRLAQELALSSGQSWRSLLSGLSQAHLAALKHVFARQQPFHQLEVALHANTGFARWLQIDGLPLWSEVGELTGYRGTASDITRSQQARAVLNLSLIHISEPTRPY